MNKSATFTGCAAFNVTEQGFTTFEYFFYIGSGVAGTAINVLTLIIALTCIDIYNKPRQLLVINMTCADLLMCLFYMTTRPYLHYFPKSLCYPYYVTICTVALSSCFYLLWLNVDKLLFLQFPLHYYQIVNRSKLNILCLITWMINIALAIFVYYFMVYISDPASCDKVSLQPIIYTPICLLYVLIITCSFAISFTIFLIAQNSSKIENSSLSLIKTLSKYRLVQCCNFAIVQADAAIFSQPCKKILNRLFFLFTSTLWTFFTCLPYRMLYLFNIIYRQLTDTYCPTTTMRTITDFFFRLLVLGTVINPVITVLTQRIYRQKLLWYFYQFGSLFRWTQNGDSNEQGKLSRLTVHSKDSTRQNVLMEDINFVYNKG